MLIRHPDGRLDRVDIVVDEADGRLWFMDFMHEGCHPFKLEIRQGKQMESGADRWWRNEPLVNFKCDLVENVRVGTPEFYKAFMESETWETGGRQEVFGVVGNQSVLMPGITVPQEQVLWTVITDWTAIRDGGSRGITCGYGHQRKEIQARKCCCRICLER